MPRKIKNSNRNNNLHSKNTDCTNFVSSSSDVVNMDYTQCHTMLVNSRSQYSNSNSSPTSMAPLIPIYNTDFIVPLRQTFSRLPRSPGK